MTVLPTVGPAELRDDADDRGLGALQTERGNLPLERIDVHATITGLVARTVLTQDFHNPHDVAAGGDVHLPAARPRRGDRPADGRPTAESSRANSQERGAGPCDVRRRRSPRATGRRSPRRSGRTSSPCGSATSCPASGSTVRLTLVGPLPYEDGEATFRFPLVVAPRYIPGAPLPGAQCRRRPRADTDAVPDASRITPPVLLPGFPNPVRLSIPADVDPAGLPCSESGPACTRSTRRPATRTTSVAIKPGERVDRTSS